MTGSAPGPRPTSRPDRAPSLRSSPAIATANSFLSGPLSRNARGLSGFCAGCRSLWPSMATFSPVPASARRPGPMRPSNSCAARAEPTSSASVISARMPPPSHSSPAASAPHARRSERPFSTCRPLIPRPPTNTATHRPSVGGGGRSRRPSPAILARSALKPFLLVRPAMPPSPEPWRRSASGSRNAAAAATACGLRAFIPSSASMRPSPAVSDVLS